MIRLRLAVRTHFSDVRVGLCWLFWDHLAWRLNSSRLGLPIVPTSLWAISEPFFDKLEVSERSRGLFKICVRSVGDCFEVLKLCTFQSCWSGAFSDVLLVPLWTISGPLVVTAGWSIYWLVGWASRMLA